MLSLDRLYFVMILLSLFPFDVFFDLFSVNKEVTVLSYFICPFHLSIHIGFLWTFLFVSAFLTFSPHSRVAMDAAKYLRLFTATSLSSWFASKVRMSFTTDLFTFNITTLFFLFFFIFGRDGLSYNV